MPRPSQKEGKIYITDCEGPISKNDNAFELTSYFLPDGDPFFALISKYDDFLADIHRKPGYKAGDTLKLILPFLKAYGATNEKILEYSSKNIFLVPGARATLEFVINLAPSFIVSTSYEQYILSLCRLTGFPYENSYCTRLDIDKYEISQQETNKLKKIRKEISIMPMIIIPENSNSFDDLSRMDQMTIRRLDEIFWEEIPKMESGKMLKEINPVGGSEKRDVVKNVVNNLDSSLNNVMYVGDSITDSMAFHLVRENGGLTISFNGNEYAIREAEIAILSDNTILASVFAEVFIRFGKDQVIELVEEWGHRGVKKYCSSMIQERLLILYPKDLPQVELITAANQRRLQEESNDFRKNVRGEGVGRLG